MKNHELLDMIGDVNEDYVLAAGDNVVRPRFRWKTWAAVAACAVLVLGAHPAYKAAHPLLHEYVVMDRDGALTTMDDIKAPAGGASSDAAPEASMVGGAYISCDPTYNEQGEEDLGSDLDGIPNYEPALDAPAQKKASAQYDNFWNNFGLSYVDGSYPEWCGGVWIDNSYYPEARLAVAIVDGFRTPELEAQIIAGCGGEVVFQDVKYSGSHLDQLMISVGKVLDNRTPDGACLGFGVDVMENRLTVDVYGCDLPKDVLADLARLDPDGDAILVRVFPNALAAIDEAAKPPAPAAIASPVPGGAREEPSIEEHIPAEVGVPPVAVESVMPAHTENEPSARYNAQSGKVEELPQAKYDVIYGADE